VNRAARIRRLARALGMAPGVMARLERGEDGRWWLMGCARGDQPLPRTRGCSTERDALDAAEAWLAPEIDCVSIVPK
jgi:hypothetical protein